MRTKPSSPVVIAGRLAKAQQFARAARDLEADEHGDFTDAFVALAVLSGVASSDVICCVRLGEYSSGQSYSDAVSLLAKVDQTAAKALNALLGLKAAAEYQHAPTSSANARRAERAMQTLLEAAIRSG